MICRLNGFVECGDQNKENFQKAMLLVEQVKVSKGSPPFTCLLEGPSGRYYMVFYLNGLISCFWVSFIFLDFTLFDSGKSALAATVGIDSDFPYVKIVSSLTYIEDVFLLQRNNSLLYCLFYIVMVSNFCPFLLFVRSQQKQWLVFMRALNVRRLLRFATLRFWTILEFVLKNTFFFLGLEELDTGIYGRFGVFPKPSFVLQLQSCQFFRSTWQLGTSLVVWFHTWPEGNSSPSFMGFFDRCLRMHTSHHWASLFLMKLKGKTWWRGSKKVYWVIF